MKALSSGVFATRVLAATGIVSLLAIIAYVGWSGIDALLLLFAGLLLAIFLRTLARWVAGHSPLSDGWALAVVVLGVLGAVAATTAVMAPAVSDQADELSRQLPQAFDQAKEGLAETALGRTFLAEGKEATDYLPKRKDLARRAAGIFSTTTGALAGIGIFFALGLYLAAEPQTYRRGVLALVPPSRRDRAAEVLDATISTLRWWLWGKILAMIVIGAATTLGLWLLEVPLALALGILAALLTFIPNLGPILAVIPAFVLALVDGPTKALSVLALYFGVQLIESYLITPLIQRRTIAMPPALTITAQILLGLMLGALGVVMATPLVAVAIVLVKMLYVEDVLAERPEA